MTNQSTFNTLASYFAEIYHLGDSIIIYQNGNLVVSLNTFLVCILVLLMLLTVLLTFVKANSGAGVDIVDHSIRNAVANHRREYK